MKTEIKETEDNTDTLSEKQKAFCLEYLLDFNGTQAAIRAGYSKKTACEQSARLLANVKIQKHIKELTGKVQKKKIMDVQEIQERLTALARGEVEEDVVVTENIGDFTSQARVVKKIVGAKDQVKALELLGKANALFVDKVDATVKNDNQELLREYLEGAKHGTFTKR